MKKIFIILSIFLILVAWKGNIINTSSVEDSPSTNSIIEKEKGEVNETSHIEKSIEKPIQNNNSASSSLSQRINDYIENNLDSEYFDAELCKIYRQVLLSEMPFSFKFIVAESENEYYLNDISYDEYKFIPNHFSFIDMNNDKVPEIVIEGSIDKSAGFVLVLREYDGRVIGHEFSHRQMSDIKRDGTYHASGGAAYNGYYQLSFNEDSYSQHNIVRMDAEEDSNGELKTIYFISEKQVEEKAFWELWEVQKNKEKPIWVDFELKKEDESKIKIMN
ncbi:hypothetical protein [Vallitalea guaymasensis]|uniref:hypothetical protein n=1 Tax=Vallitalea guaymasensis TaxID=1185412 RepID=UPI000DE265F2|nr:hypothetical protein [Vallitalea guaymasensis]